MKTTRNLWPWGVFAAFTLFFVGMTSVVVIAATHRDSLVSPNYYEQELKFQGRLDAAALAKKSGASVRLDDATGKILATVPLEQLKQKLTGKISFYRPNAPELDHEIPFAPGADGTQSCDTAGLAAGSWHVRVSWNAGGQDYYLEERITL